MVCGWLLGGCCGCWLVGAWLYLLGGGWLVGGWLVVGRWLVGGWWVVGGWLLLCVVGWSLVVVVDGLSVGG